MHIVFYYTERRIKYKDRVIKLSEMEFNILAYLYFRRGNYVKKSEIMKYIYGHEYIYVTDSIIALYVRRINKKFEEKIISNRQCIGYTIKVSTWYIFVRKEK